MLKEFEDRDLIIGIPDIARLAQVPIEQVAHLLRAGLVPARKINGTYVMTRSSLDTMDRAASKQNASRGNFHRLVKRLERESAYVDDGRDLLVGVLVKHMAQNLSKAESQEVMKYLVAKYVRAATDARQMTGDEIVTFAMKHYGVSRKFVQEASIMALADTIAIPSFP